jgi:hypothetical protein
MLAVYCFIVKSADYNYLTIDFLSKQLNVLDIIQENGFKLVTICETYVEEEKYNSDYIIEDRFYDIYMPYHLVKGIVE